MSDKKVSYETRASEVVNAGVEYEDGNHEKLFIKQHEIEEMWHIGELEEALNRSCRITSVGSHITAVRLE